MSDTRCQVCSREWTQTDNAFDCPFCEVERLRAENERLREECETTAGWNETNLSENERLRRDLRLAHEQAQWWEDQVAELMAENERLRTDAASALSKREQAWEDEFAKGLEVHAKQAIALEKASEENAKLRAVVEAAAYQQNMHDEWIECDEYFPTEDLLQAMGQVYEALAAYREKSE